MNPEVPRSCLTPEEFEAFADGRLSPEIEAASRRHLDECPKCREQFAEMADDERIFADLREARRRLTEEPVTHTRATGQAAPINLGDAEAVIEGYSITRELGRGGMGVVFEAVQQRLSRKVALKILPGSAGLRDRDALDRFRREATAAARLHHTNIVPVYDFGQSGNSHFYAMELVEGRPLTEMIRRLAAANAPTATQERLDRILRDATDVETPGSSATFNKVDSFAGSGSGVGSSATGRGRVYYRHVARWMADAADALHYAHDQDIIHRDIKPSNLLLACDGRIMILDFGLAKTHGDRSVTMIGAIVGTLRYMSPEQAMAKRMKVDHRTDIYSLGATMYELLTFQPAFAGSDDKETLGLIITRDPTAPRKIVSAVPRDLETICLKTLEKDPAARYATAKELAADLRSFMDDRPISAKPPGPIGRAVKYMRRRRAATVAVAASALLLVSAVVAVTYAKGAQRERDARVRNLLELARQHLSKNNLNEAEANCVAALNLDPGNWAAYVNQATVQRFRYEETHDAKFLDEGIRLVDRAIAKEPLKVAAWNLKGVLMRLGDRLDGAEAAHKKGVELDPKNYANWTSLANVYALKGDFEQAEKCLVEATKLESGARQSMAWHNLAAIQLLLRRPQARASCDEAIKYGNRDVGSLLLLAKTLLTLPGQQNLRMALDSAITADGLSPAGQKDARIKRIRALAELRMQRFEDAIASAEAALSLNDRLPFVYYILAIAETKLGQLEKAHEHVLQAKALWPRGSNGKYLKPEIMQGAIWIDSMEDMSALRSEAERLLSGAGVLKPD